MSAIELVVTAAMGLAVNECCDLSPALARALVRWSARRHYRDPVRAAERAEEWAAYINDRPGKLFKLCSALRYAVSALVSGQETRAAAISGSALAHTPAPLVIAFDQHTPYRPGIDNDVWHSRIDQMKEAWNAIAHDVDAATRPVCRRGELHRRLRKLREATADDRWDAVAANVALLRLPVWHFAKEDYRPGASLGQFGAAPGILLAQPTAVPAESVVTAYLAAAQQTRDDIRALSGPFARLP
jgi:hypothetical protein